MDARVSGIAPETTAVAPTGLAVPPERRRVVLSPINRRRWQNFKRNRRGFWSLWIFLTLFVISLFAEEVPLLLEGAWSGDTFEADSALIRHDENYEVPEEGGAYPGG